MEQFGFLEVHQIHEDLGSTQKGLHYIKTKDSLDMVLKLDLSKAFDRTYWFYLRELLISYRFSTAIG
jgi:hypothetical protein